MSRKRKLERKRTNEPDDIELHLMWKQLDPSTPLKCFIGELQRTNPRLAAYVRIRIDDIIRTKRGLIARTLAERELEEEPIGAVYSLIEGCLKLKRKMQLSPERERKAVKVGKMLMPKKTRADDVARDNAIKYAETIYRRGGVSWEEAYRQAAEQSGISAATIKKARQRRKDEPRGHAPKVGKSRGKYQIKY